MLFNWNCSWSQSFAGSPIVNSRGVRKFFHNYWHLEWLYLGLFCMTPLPLSAELPDWCSASRWEQHGVRHGGSWCCHCQRLQENLDSRGDFNCFVLFCRHVQRISLFCLEKCNHHMKRKPGGFMWQIVLILWWLSCYTDTLIKLVFSYFAED